MTRETIFKFFITDKTLIERQYITKEQSEALEFVDDTGIKLVQVIKMAIIDCVSDESSNTTSRKINQYLNGK